MSTRGKHYTQESAGSGSSSTSGDRICYCGLQALMQVSTIEANPGREYYSCPNGRCRWFTWAGLLVNRSGRLGGQKRERDAEDSIVGMGSSLLLLERVRKLENDNEVYVVLGVLENAMGKRTLFVADGVSAPISTRCLSRDLESQRRHVFGLSKVVMNFIGGFLTTLYSMHPFVACAAEWTVRSYV
ncbi:hypothetical protein PIB30_022936 [Stylosanthes scabra]|uniref:GRF-type domain-containing protein n=1 Tax=Stylosanthes scabra TaxID=79078 RepID=A0ABU6R9K3_9FABA|nr:hypothetical protein [Stylosanthes scabra]